MKILVKAPAKINLSLDILHKRNDGYHEVDMVMTTIDLADRLEAELRYDGKITLDCQVSYVPTDENNHVYKAAKIVKDEFNIDLGVHFNIDKQIPVAAGLAGGSSDAAAAIKCLNQLWGLGMSVEKMAELGAKVGSDVSFCIYGGTARATGRGEVIQPLPAPPPCWVILAKPPIGVSTSEIYSRFDIQTQRDYKTAKVIDAIHRGDFKGICDSLGNHLETVTFDLYHEVKRIKEQMKRFGADGVLMSGSGPTVFALVQKESRANRIYNGLRGFCKEVYVVRLLG